MHKNLQISDAIKKDMPKKMKRRAGFKKAESLLLVQHCGNNGEYSTRYFRHRRALYPKGHAIVSQRCTRHRLPPPPCADKNIGHCIHRYFRNAVLVMGMILTARRVSEDYFQLLLIQGNSMNPSCHHMQLAVINKYERFYTYGDVVVFTSSRLKAVLVKRVAAVPGDTVQIKDGTLLVNNRASEVYEEEGMFQYAGIVSEEMRLAEDEYFVIGDNAGKSRDSRYREVGMVKEAEILGKVIW